jgi:hypothetical protein
MASFEERIYELGTEALAEQERQVVETRGRGTASIAAGAVIASLLAKPVFHGGHPHGFFEIAAAAAGLLGCSGVLLFVVLLLRPRELGFSVKAGATYRSLWEQGITEQPTEPNRITFAGADAASIKARPARSIISSTTALLMVVSVPGR